jgi:mannose-1-phosphate guanylyltransferase/mannose-6-phosphate isomerase
MNAADDTPDGRPPVSDVQRPWGGFRQYAHNAPVTVSLMTVQPGQRLSLQSHRRRAELWIVLDDGAEVQCGECVRAPRAGEEIWIPAGERHRLSCKGEAPVRVVEVAFGDWQMDDIERFADDYGREDPDAPRIEG